MEGEEEKAEGENKYRQAGIGRRRQVAGQAHGYRHAWHKGRVRMHL